MATYSIWEGHMDDLMKKVKRIEKKCAKYGCDFHFEEVGEEYKEVALPKSMQTEENETVTCRFVIVEVEGTAIINDWELVAFTEHTDKGNIYSKINTEVEIPARYRASDCFCEHCKTKRARKNTCIVRNIATNEFKQVGNTCLKYFTRGMDAGVVTMFASLKDVFEEAQEAPIGGRGWSERYLDKEEMLRYAAETIRHFGYAKSDGGRSTKERMLDYFNADRHNFGTYVSNEFIKQIKSEMSECGFNAESDEVKKMTEDALAWIAEQEESNDYMHNLKVVCSLDYVGYKNLGILVSLFPTYDRELERQAERTKREAKQADEQNSEFMGEVGKKLTANVVSCKVVTSWTNSYDGYNCCTTYMYKFVTEDGNVLIWKTSKSFNEDAVKSISGTVKEHNEFRGVKQTVLTRCKVTVSKPARTNSLEEILSYI